MHRAYQSLTPANNKLLKKRWDTSEYDIHRKKVKNASAVIDNHPPPTYLHLHLKLKKMQLEEERLATVERDNRILLEKMSYIMRTRGRIDNQIDSAYCHKSLNKPRRQRELLRITHENQAILKRLTAKEPHLNHHYWKEEWELHQRYGENITKYPKNIGIKELVLPTKPVTGRRTASPNSVESSVDGHTYTKKQKQQEPKLKSPGHRRTSKDGGRSDSGYNSTVNKSRRVSSKSEKPLELDNQSNTDDNSTSNKSRKSSLDSEKPLELDNQSSSDDNSTSNESRKSSLNFEKPLELDNQSSSDDNSTVNESRKSSLNFEKPLELDNSL